MFCFQNFFHSCPPKLYANPAGVVDEELNPESVNPVTNAALSSKFEEVDELVGIASMIANDAAASAISAQERLQAVIVGDLKTLKDTVAGLTGGDATGAIQNAIDAAEAATRAANSAKDAAGNATVAAGEATAAANNATAKLGELQTYVGGVNGLANAADRKGTDALIALDQLTPQVVTLNNDVAGIKGRMDNVDTAVDGIDESLNTLTDGVENVRTAVDNIDGALNTLTERVEFATTAVDNINEYLNEMTENMDELNARPVPKVYITGVRSMDVPAFTGENVDESVRSYNILTEYSDGTRLLRCKLTGVTLDVSTFPPTDPAYVDFIVRIDRASDQYSLSGMFCSAPNCQSMPLGPHSFAHCGDIKILGMDTSPTSTTFRMKLYIVPVYRAEGAYEIGDISFEIVMYKDGVY